MVKNQVFVPAVLDELKIGSLQDPYTLGLRIEVQTTGRKIWKFERRLPKSRTQVRLSFGEYPRNSIGAAREWAGQLNALIDQGIDPRAKAREEEARTAMTVSKAHGLYMEAVKDGTSSRAKRKNKPRTINDKLKIFRLDIEPVLGKRSIYDITEQDLIDLVLKKGKVAKIRANRLAAELKVFFGWAASLRGRLVGLTSDPSYRMTDLRYPEQPRTRKLSLDEIEFFLKALLKVKRDFRRGFLLCLLTAVRISELIYARSEEVSAGMWVIPGERIKNGNTHSIALGPWGQAMMESESEWVFPAERVEGPRTSDWYKARNVIVAEMTRLAGRPIERFKPHDLRRTARSNTKRLKVDYETAEAMLNHLKVGLERVYDGYELEEEKAAWFLTWENEIIRIARNAGIADELEVPAEAAPPELLEAAE